jgi:2-polyprenyl-3-methyl-5-hydroxy-6-metoxy-1,4-benzoquinol methylase
MASGHIEAEAAAFDARIRERLAAGFVPDLRRAAHCEYFYKSFWRDPHYVDLYLGEAARTFLDLLGRYATSGARILDVGCGAGYMTLEWARAGYDVLGVDISRICIDAARETLATSPFRDNFGSLRYEVSPFEEVTGTFDVVLFSGALHHFAELPPIMRKTSDLLSPNGLILCHEPYHEQWRVDDAAQVVLIRALLALTGYWYEPEPEGGLPDNPAALMALIDETQNEYIEERDTSETAQSPSDNSSSGARIMEALHGSFEQLDCRPSVSFIYRLLGGLRGPTEITNRIADFLALYDRTGVAQGFLKPNGFYYAGRKIA